jgi:hypothetical protein
LSELTVELRLQAWSAWADGITEQSAWRAWAATGAALPSPAAAAANAMPALLRRRLGRGDRQGIEAAYAAGAAKALPVAWASRHGQIVRSAQLLAALARGEAPAPMDFSLSVHNAPLGLLAIATDDQAPASAVAAGDESLTAALLEAQGWILEGAPQALVVHADEAPPPDYAGRWDGDAADFGLALRLGREGETITMSLDLVLGPDDAEALPTRFLRFLAGGTREGSWSRGGRRWSWSRA